MQDCLLFTFQFLHDCWWQRLLFWPPSFALCLTWCTWFVLCFALTHVRWNVGSVNDFLYKRSFRGRLPRENTGTWTTKSCNSITTQINNLLNAGSLNVQLLTCRCWWCWASAQVKCVNEGVQILAHVIVINFFSFLFVNSLSLTSSLIAFNFSTGNCMLYTPPSIFTLANWPNTHSRSSINQAFNNQLPCVVYMYELER